jgi:hypothetical protein
LKEMRVLWQGDKFAGAGVTTTYGLPMSLLSMIMAIAVSDGCGTANGWLPLCPCLYGYPNGAAIDRSVGLVAT